MLTQDRINKVVENHEKIINTENLSKLLLNNLHNIQLIIDQDPMYEEYLIRLNFVLKLFKIGIDNHKLKTQKFMEEVFNPENTEKFKTVIIDPIQDMLNQVTNHQKKTINKLIRKII